MAFKEFTPEEWLEQIDDGLEYRRLYGLEDKWGHIEAIYYNVHGSMMNDGPNLFLSQGDAMLSAITVPVPKIAVQPTGPETVNSAPIVERLDNMLLDELDIPSEVDAAAFYAYLWGAGFIKIGYDSEWGYDPSYDIGGNLQVGLTLTQLDRKGRRKIEYDQNVAPGMPWIRAVMPHDIVVPWGTRRLSNAPWIAHRVIRHIDDIKADRKYSGTRGLQPQLSMKDFMDSYKTAQRPYRRRSGMTIDGQEYVELYEIHDRRTNKIFVVTWDHPRFLRSDFNMLQIGNRLPFVHLGFIPRSKSLWVTPDTYYLYHVQNEVSDVAVQRSKQRRIAALKFLYSESVLEPQEVQKLMSPQIGVAAKVSGQFDLSKAIMKLDNTPNLLLHNEEEQLRANAREQIGFSRNQVGEYTGGRRTATEAMAVDRGSARRMSRRGLQMKRLYEDMITILNGVMFEFWTLPRYVEVLGPQTTERWVQVNGPAIKGRYRYSVSFIDDVEEQGRKVEALQLYAFLRQDPLIDPFALKEELIREFNDPGFRSIFRADLSASMSQMQGGGGGVLPQNAGGGGTPQLPGGVQRPNGQASRTALEGSVAGRGVGA